MATASEQVYRELRRKLAEGHYRAGEHLREEDLADALGVSRTPIREAVRRLAAEGWVRMVPNLGAFAAEWTAADIAEIFALRALLEPHAAAHAATRATQDDVAELTELCERGESAVRKGEAPDLQVISEANLAFHKAILRISAQTRTESIVTTLYAMPIILKNFSRYDRRHLQRSQSQHRELTEAIAARDSSWASAVMRSHVEAGKALFIDSSEARMPRLSAQFRSRNRSGVGA